jgi:hypothetical protein
LGRVPLTGCCSRVLLLLGGSASTEVQQQAPASHLDMSGLHSGREQHRAEAQSPVKLLVKLTVKASQRPRGKEGRGGRHSCEQRVGTLEV